MLAHLCHQVHQKWKVDTPVGSVLGRVYIPYISQVSYYQVCVLLLVTRVTYYRQIMPVLFCLLLYI